MPHTNIPPTDKSPATRDDIQRLERQIAELRSLIERHEREIQLQVTRTGQLQADIDIISGAWAKIRSEP